MRMLCYMLCTLIRRIRHRATDINACFAQRPVLAVPHVRDPDMCRYHPQLLHLPPQLHRRICDMQAAQTPQVLLAVLGKVPARVHHL